MLPFRLLSEDAETVPQSIPFLRMSASCFSDGTYFNVILPFCTRSFNIINVSQLTPIPWFFYDFDGRLIVFEVWNRRLDLEAKLLQKPIDP